jgi:hypothetical protein
MRNYISPLLLLLVLVALVADIFIRARPVHAQPALFIDQVSAMGAVRHPVKIGGDFVAFSCATDFCYILSK